MRLVNEKYEDINEFDIDLEKGKTYVKRIIKPDAEPVDNIKKFAYVDGDYEEVTVYERIPDKVLIADRINELKRNLADTDYVVLKIAEGVATAEEYAETIANRKVWRKEINELEASLSAMTSGSV